MISIRTPLGSSRNANRTSCDSRASPTRRFRRGWVRGTRDSSSMFSRRRRPLGSRAVTRSVYVASPEGLTGKSAVALGLLDALTREVGSVGVFRPLTTVGSDGRDRPDRRPAGQPARHHADLRRGARRHLRRRRGRTPTRRMHSHRRAVRPADRPLRGDPRAGLGLHRRVHRHRVVVQRQDRGQPRLPGGAGRARPRAHPGADPGRRRRRPRRAARRTTPTPWR